MKITHRILPFLLTSLLLFTACQKKPGMTETSKDSFSDTSAESDTFPHEIKTFDGMTFRVFSDYNAPDGLEFTDFDLEKDSSVTIESVVYKRKRLCLRNI